MAAEYFNSQPQFTTTTGKPLSGGKVFTYANGTTTNKSTWKEAGLSNLNTNPIILDASGRFPFPVFANDSDVFTILIKDSNDVVIYPSKDDQSFSGAFSISSADVLAALASNSAAVVINGSEITGTAFQSFASALTLTAAGSADFSAGAVTLGAVTGATAFGASVSVGGILNLGGDNATIASGVITATQSFQTIATEGGAAADDLDTISGGVEGDVIILTSQQTGQNTTVKDGTGNINLASGADFVLSHPHDKLMLIFRAVQWDEISRSDNT